MNDPNGRYARTEVTALETPDGQTIPYLRRRFLPQGETLPVLVELRLAEADRLDLVAGRILGNPLLSWRICDANNAMNPEELVGDPERLVRVPLPRPDSGG